MKAILGRRPGVKRWEIVLGPEASQEQRRQYWNSLKLDKTSRSYAECILMESTSKKKLTGGRPGQDQDSSSSNSSSSSASSQSTASSLSSVNSSSSSSSSQNSSSSSSTSSNSSSSS